MKNIVFLIALISIISCKKDNIQYQIIGQWNALYDKSRSYEFTENGTYNEYMNGKNLSEMSHFTSLTYEIDNDNLFPELTILNKKKSSILDR